MGVKFSECYQRPPSPVKEDINSDQNYNYKR